MAPKVMEYVLRLALRFIDGFVWPWRLVAVFAWTISVGGTSSCLKWIWWLLSSPLGLVTAAWREQQAQEKVSALRAKIEAMAHTILDLETNLEVAQTERLRMRDRLNAALADRQRFYERAVKALAKAKRLKVELEERYEAEGSEFGTDHDASQVTTPGKMDSDVKLLKDQVSMEAAAETATQEAAMKTVASESPEVAPAEEPNFDELKETDDEDTKTIRSNGPKAGRGSYADVAARTAGAWFSFLCIVLAGVGAWAVYKFGLGSQRTLTVPFIGLSVVCAMAMMTWTMFKKTGKHIGRRVSRAQNGTNMFVAMGMLSLDWLALGFMACVARACILGPSSIQDRMCWL